MKRPGTLLCLLVLACRPDGSAGSVRAPPAADSLRSAGESLYARSEYDSAHSLWSSALELARGARDSALTARLLTSIGLAEWRLGDYAASRRNGEAALALKRMLSPPPDLFTSYNGLGLLAWNEGRLADAAALLDTARALAQASRDPEQAAKVKNNLGLVHTELGEYHEARAGFESALQSARAAASPRLAGNALLNGAMLDIRMGAPERAIGPLADARAEYQSIQYVTGEISALGQLGVAHASIGRFDDAFGALDTALALARRHGLRQEEAGNLEALADVYHAAGEPRRALEFYSTASRIDREIGLPVELGSNLRQTALILLGMGNHDAARRQADSALQAHREAGVRAEVLQDLLLLAELEEGASSRTRLREAALLVDSLGVTSARAALVLARSRLAIAAGDSRRALADLNAARADLLTGNFATEWEAYDLFAAAHASLGNLDDAAAAGRKAVESVEQVRSRTASGLLRSTYLARRTSAYHRLADILLRQGKAWQAAAVADAVKARTLTDRLLQDAGGARAGSKRDALLERIGALADHVSDLESEAAEADDSATIAIRREAARALAAARADFERSERHAASRPPDVLDPRAFASSLGSDELVIAYSVREDRTVIFAIRSDSVAAIVSAEGLGQLRARVRLARTLLADSSGKGDRGAEVLEALYASLIGPVEAAGMLAGISRLVVVPYGGLAYLPFSALRNRATGRYLIEDFELEIAPSIAAMAAARRRPVRRNESGTRRLVLAPFPADLPESVREAADVRRLARGFEEWVGSHATESRLRRAAPEAGVLHLATHAELNAENPLFSRIRLHAGSGRSDDDGSLELHEILGLRLPGSLVFLSGCETALGGAWSTHFDRVEDYSTLLEAFLHAGADAVVGTLWPVGDAPAARVAVAFYRALDGNRDATAALASAQRAMIADQRHASPYLWAGYTVTAHRRNEALVSVY